MKKVILYLFLFTAFLSYAQKNIYESNKFNELSKDHKVLAILPFITRLHLEENISKSELIALEEKEGYAVQNALETYFFKQKKRKKFSVEFQNIKDTKAILAKHNISYKNLDLYTTKELAKLLGVDGIISGNIDLNILLSKGIATNLNLLDYILGVSNFGRIGIKISDGSTGKLLWKYENKINKKTGKNTAALIDGMMKRAARKFPYDKERPRDRKGK